MVRFDPVTGKEKKEKKREEQIKGLVKEVFGNEVKIISSGGFSLHLNLGDDSVVDVYHYRDLIILKNPHLVKKTYNFAQKYEERGLLSSENEVTIKTDYS